jgi:hypothetical protein
MDRFLAAALHGIVKVGIDASQVIVVHTGVPKNEALGAVRLCGATLIPLVGLSGSRPLDDLDVYSDYGTLPFNLLMQHRIDALRLLIRSHERILVADLDVAWLRNPLSYVAARLDTFPWVSQTECVERFPCFCAGFFAFRDCEFSRNLLDAIWDRSRLDAAALGDQEYLNRILSEQPNLVRNIFPLPESLFPNGILTHTVLHRADEVFAGMLGRPDPFIYHANFTIGLPNKTKLMEAVGAFAAPEWGARDG